MESLTEKEALLICREQWQWLADTGSTDKGYILREKGIEAQANCMLCEYDDQVLRGDRYRGEDSCTFCLLENIAWGEQGDCLSRDSIFSVWDEAGEDTPEHKRIRKASASDMVCSISYALREKGYE